MEDDHGSLRFPRRSAHSARAAQHPQRSDGPLLSSLSVAGASKAALLHGGRVPIGTPRLRGGPGPARGLARDDGRLRHSSLGVIAKLLARLATPSSLATVSS